MRPSSLLHLYRVRLRSRAMQELLAVAGIAVGVALVFAALVANTSLIGSMRELNRELVGDARFQVSAAGAEGIDERLVGVVQRIDGVAGVSTVLEVPANVSGPDGRRSVLLISGIARLMRFSGPAVRRFGTQVEATRVTRTRAVSLSAPLAAALGVRTGERVQLETARHRVKVPIGARLQRSDYGDTVYSPLVLASLPFAQRVSDMRGRLSRIFVLTEPGRDNEVRRALHAVAPRAHVVDADHDAAAFERAAYSITLSTSVFSVFAAFIGFMFAFSAVLLTVPQRRRFIADLRIAGHDPWVTLELLLFDALVLGVTGSLLGLAGGYLAVRDLLEIVPGLLTYAFPIGEQVKVTWQCVALAIATGAVAACFAVLIPLRDAVPRRRRAAARRGDGYGPGAGAVVLGFGTLALGTALSVLAPKVGAFSFAAMTAAVMLFLPTLLRASTAAFAALTRAMRTPVPTLAMLELRSRSTRTRALAVASTAAIAVSATVSLDGAHADLQRGLDAAASASDRNGDVWVTFRGNTSAFATAPLGVSAATIRALRTLPGVERVAIYRGSFLDIGDRRTWAQGLPRSAPIPLAPSQIREGDPEAAARHLRDGGWIVLSTAIAGALGARIGERVTLPAPAPTELRVAAISTNLGWPSGAVVLNADDYARAWRSSAPSALQIAVAPGASPSVVAAAVRHALPAALPTQVETRAVRTARHYAASRDSLHRLNQVAALVLISAILAIVGVMAGMLWQRRPAIARLKVHGYPEGELWRALLLECALLLGTGCLTGAAFGLYGQVVMTRGLRTLTDFPVVYVAAAPSALGILLLVTVVTVAMVALPGWLAVRVQPAPGRTA